MKNLTDSDYLLQRQYRDAGNLRARIALHQGFSTNHQGLPAWFIEQLHIPEKRVDTRGGLRPRGLLAQVAESIPPSWHITVSDFSPGMVSRAWQRLDMLHRPFTVMQADVQNLPFPDGAFDV